MTAKFILRPRFIALTLFWIATAIVGIFLILVLVIDGFDAAHWGGTLALLNVNAETSIPTWFGQTLLLIAALLLGMIASQVRDYRVHWSGLAGIFLYLSIDEGAQIHEQATIPMRNLFGITNGVLFFSWVIVFAVIVVVIGLLYVTFLQHLPASTSQLFLVAASLFITGAIGFEMIGAQIAAGAGENGTKYALVVGAEEYLEMVGTVTFIYALLEYCQQKFPTFELGFSNSR